MYYVYLHTNKSNGKKYVGMTGKLPKQRWQKGRGYLHNKSFYEDILKYGWDEGFTHEVLYANLTKIEARVKESRLIAEYNLTNPLYGYNLKGGKIV